MESNEWTQKKKLLLNTAHDLRTPLTSVKGYLEMIKAGFVECGSPEYWSFISVIEKCVVQVETLTTDLLDSYKLESRAMRLDLEKIPLDQFIKEIEAQINPILSGKGQKLVNVSPLKGSVMIADNLKIT